MAEIKQYRAREQAAATSNRVPLVHTRGAVCGYAPGERLVVELQRELNDSRWRRRDADRAERAACNVQARDSEVGPVERVEEFGAELEVLRLGQMQVFRQREIEVDQARSAHHANAGGPEHLSLTRINRGECGGVEPFSNGLRSIRVSDQIRASASLAAKVKHAVAVLDRAQGKPALESVNPGQVPSAEDGID